jgi:hypothetical protein
VRKWECTAGRKLGVVRDEGKRVRVKWRTADLEAVVVAVSDVGHQCSMSLHDVDVDYQSPRSWQ